MGTTFKPLYASHAALTFTSLASLSGGAAAGCLAVDNTTNLYEDVLFTLALKTGASGTSATGNCAIYAYGETDGTNFTDAVTGTDATQTLTAPTNLKLVGIMNMVANSVTYIGGPFSAAAAFGGILPQKWGLVVVNNTGAALASSGSSADMMGINEQIP